MPEISVISRFGGSEAPPQSPVKKNAKNKNFEKNSCEKKKAEGQNLTQEKKAEGQNPTQEKKGRGAKF